MNLQKIRVGVLMGGKSIENEVSFNSGRTICDHLDTECYTIIPIFQTIEGTLYILPGHFLYRGKIADFEHRLAHEATQICWDDLKDLVDFIYIAIHGQYAEDGTVQGILELFDIPYLGSGVFASALSMDKTIQKSFLRISGIDVPRSISVMPNQIGIYTKNINALLDLLEQAGIKTPYIVKPNNEGSSLGISIVKDKQKLLSAIRMASMIYPSKKQPVLIEEKIEGMEFSCITITDYKTGKFMPLPATEVIVDNSVQFFDYEQKYMPGRATEFTPPRCSKKLQKKIQDTCIKAMQALGITNISRIDGFVTNDERIVIIDPNSLSGMGPASFLFREAAEVNLSHTELINHLIETELHEYGLTQKEYQNKTKTTLIKVKKTRVAVLMGGRTNEKEISLESGRNVAYKLSPHKYDVIPIFVNHNLELFTINQSILVRNSTHEIETLLEPKMKVRWSDLPNLADFIFLGLHGGEGENGCIQGMLEMLNLPYNGSSVLTSALCMDKYMTAKYLRAHTIEVPKSLLISKQDWHNKKKELLQAIFEMLPSFPLIVKPHDDGCSIMVQKVSKQNDLEAAIEHIFLHDKEYAMIEEYIVGMELTVGIIGNEKAQALPPSQAIAQAEILSIKEKFLPGAGENQTPAPLSKDTITYIQQVMEQTYTIIGCKGYARIDCFYQSAQQSPTKKERVIIIEINTLPALTPSTCLFHQAAEIGIKPMDFIDLIVKLGLQEHRRETKHPVKTKQPLFQKEA
ncbi:ATP-grasp domain-containing protein [Candidatus Dependentiae bacterium]|nr:MAG: ATP-grasp domain-containing protein [Candidatus Dependentiae bacterium]